MNFDSISTSIFVKILQFLDPVTRCKARRVATRWNDAILYNNEWSIAETFCMALSVFQLKKKLKHFKPDLVRLSLQDFVKLENFERTIDILKPETACLEGITRFINI